ncbi:MAG TPA: hypothetical protein VGK13_07745 [Methanocellaceae archaeon]
MGDHTGKTVVMTTLVLLAIFSVLLATQPVLSWQPGVDWAKTYVSNGSGTTLRLTSDGGYVIAGTAIVNGSNDVLLIKTDAQGTVQWSKTYGGTGSEFGMSLIVASDGGYAVVGISNGSDALLMKTDASGTLLWTKTYGGTGTEKGYDVRQATDGGYVIAGESDSGANAYVLLIKTDAGGALQWSNTYGVQGSSSTGYSVQCSDDGGYVITGDSVSNGSRTYVVKTDAGGAVQWDKAYAGAHSARTYSIVKDSDGYEIAGDVLDGGIHSAYLVKIDPSGKELWNRTYYGSGNEWYAKSLTKISDGFIMAGQSHNITTGTDSLLLIRTSSDGTIQWSGVYGVLNSCMGFSAQRATDGTYVAAGTAYNGSGFYALLLKTNSAQPPSTYNPPVTVINIYVPSDITPTTAPWISPTPMPTMVPTPVPGTNTATPTATAIAMPTALPDSGNGSTVPIAVAILCISAAAAGAIYLLAFKKK